MTDVVGADATVDALIGAAKNALCLVDANGGVLKANDAFTDLTGIEKGSSVLQRLTAAGKASLAFALGGEASRIGGQSTHQFDTTKTWVAVATPLQSPEGLRVLLAADSAESGARESEQSWHRLTHASLESQALATALESLPIGVVLVEIEDAHPPTIVAHNRAYSRILGLADHDQPFTDGSHTIFLPDGTTVALDDLPGPYAARTGQTIRDVVLHVRGADGSRRVITSSAAPIVDSGQVRRAVSVFLDVTERVLAEEAQRASELRCAGVFESFRDPSAVFEAVPGQHGIEWFYREANDALVRLVGMKKEALVGQALGAAFPERAARLRPTLETVLVSGASKELEVLFDEKDYFVRLFRLGPSEVVITALDTTPSKRAERALRASTERFEVTASTLPGALYDYVVDSQGRPTFVYLSPGARDIFEVPVVDLLAHPTRFWSMVHAEDAPALLRGPIDAHANRAEVEVRIITPSGAAKCLRFSWRQNDREGDGMVRGSGFILDVTEASNARIALARSRRELLDLVEKLPIGVFVSRDGAILYANPELARFCGCAPSELAGKDTTDVFVIEPDQSGALPVYGATVDPFSDRREWTHRRKDGRSVRLETSSSREVELEGQRAHLVTVRDLTELRAMRAQLMQSDRLASVGMLAAGVAHEINNPLAYLIAALDFMGETLESERPILGDLGHALADAREGASRVRQVVRDLKTFSRAEPERAAIVDLHQLLDSSANMASNEIRHRAQLVKNYGPVPPVHANEARLGQVFVNLLVNAAQAIPEGRAAHNEVRITTFTADDGSAVVEVRDTGAGIPESALEHIFDPFFTTKPAGIGTGLGLAICRTTVESLGGTIHVENLPKRGVAFRICLAPYVGTSVVPKSNRASIPMGRRGRVLVVDDESLIANGLARVLGSEHDVTCLTSSREALARCEAGERFDVILCDLMMPELSGMDLHEAVRVLDSEQANRFVFLTGGAFTDRAAAFLDRSSNHCVEKPYDATSLRALVRTIVG